MAGGGAPRRRLSISALPDWQETTTRAASPATARRSPLPHRARLDGPSGPPYNRPGPAGTPGPGGKGRGAAFKGRALGSGLPRTRLQGGRARQHAGARGARRRNHLHGALLHHLRPAGHDVGRRHRALGRVRGHLRRQRHRLRADGPAGQLPDSARARHGAQRLLRLRGGGRARLLVAAGPDRRLHRRLRVRAPLVRGLPRTAHGDDPREPEARDCGRHRADDRVHRPPVQRPGGRLDGHRRPVRPHSQPDDAAGALRAGAHAGADGAERARRRALGHRRQRRAAPCSSSTSAACSR